MFFTRWKNRGKPQHRASRYVPRTADHAAKLERALDRIRNEHDAHRALVEERNLPQRRSG